MLFHYLIGPQPVGAYHTLRVVNSEFAVDKGEISRRMADRLSQAWRGPMRVLSGVLTPWVRLIAVRAFWVLFSASFIWFGFWIASRHLEGYSLLLVRLTSIGLPIAVAAGLFFPASWLWGWADPVYYVLGVIGVILLFISSERERTLADLHVRLEQLGAQQQKHDASPVQLVGETGSYFLRTAYEGIQVFADLGKACQAAHAVDGKCIEAEELEHAIDGAFAGFNLPSTAPKSNNDTEVAFLDFCKRGQNLLATLPGTNIAFNELGASLGRLSHLQLQPMEFGTSDEEREALHKRLVLWDKQVALQVPERQRAFAEDEWSEEIGFVDRLHWALSICLRVPKNARKSVEALASWQQAGVDLQRRRSDLETSIAKLTAPRQDNPALGTRYDFLWRQFWPFVLVGALCLKLAKATAALKPKSASSSEEAPSLGPGEITVSPQQPLQHPS